MGSWNTGFTGVADAAALKKENITGPEKIIKAARDAAAGLIDSGELGDGPHNVSISGSDEGQQTVTITITSPLQGSG